MTNKQSAAPFEKMMIVRTVILLIAWLNQFLVMKGYSPIEFSNEDVELGVTFGFAFIASIWAWWKNNDVRYKARRNTQYLKNNGLK
ncbi:holin, SPP1 family [Psychrobacillus sp. OK028]|uniref:phage holin n=1 Tax=Psychrobacillus sp. OK028 TaxID=1884359 RepID=UPI0008872E82|nr:phage holin [Psychrobacillus sp. OK028]SDN09606.1 holin, SPP1 family [Psychrobacillus sp. OK028]